MTLFKALEIKCDACGYSERLDSNRLSDEWPNLRKLGWTRANGRHYCPVHDYTTKIRKKYATNSN
jgi:hypothetical protein